MHTSVMTEPSRFRVRIDELEASVRVDSDATVESTPTQAEPLPDPRGEDPDRSWFEAGG
jgi:hypothetical protein